MYVQVDKDASFSVKKDAKPPVMNNGRADSQIGDSTKTYYCDDEDELNGSVEEMINEGMIKKGEKFDNMIKFMPSIKGEDVPKIAESFEDLGLEPCLLHNIKELMKYSVLTPVQKCVIPCISAGRDVLASSQTGSGKTASFVIPIVDKLLKSGRSSCADEICVSQVTGRKVIFPRALVLLPTRELAIQTNNEFRKFAYKTWIRPGLVYGGINHSKFLTKLNEGVHIISATIGKLLEFLDCGKISLKKVRFVVIDEADRLMDNNSYGRSLEHILKQYDIPSGESKQISVFSATFPHSVRALTLNILIDPIVITIERDSDIPPNLKQDVIFVENDEKFEKLTELLLKQIPGKTLIFVNSIAMVDTIDDALYKKNLPVTSIHSGRSQIEREDAITAFRRNVKPIIIATDVASRGLDIVDITHVINYELPKNIEIYIHRVGRTARLGNSGLATSFFNYKDENLARPLADILIAHNQKVPRFISLYASQNSNNENGNNRNIIELEYPDSNTPFPSSFNNVIKDFNNLNLNSRFENRNNSFIKNELVSNGDSVYQKDVGEW